MTTKTIYIDESNKYAKAFLSYLQSLDFVRIEENEEETIPSSQINETRRRISLINSGEIATRSWDEAKKDIFD
jgi:vacuolar-type H+-ATPase subunit I/STV1